jgi:hypothetical protein
MSRSKGKRSRSKGQGVRVKGSGVKVGRTEAAVNWIVDDRQDRTPHPRVPDRVVGRTGMDCVYCLQSWLQVTYRCTTNRILEFLL